MSDWQSWINNVNEGAIDSMSKGYNQNSVNYLVLRLIKEKSTVLSAGCGSGREIGFLFNNLNCKVIGVDISPKMIELSSRKNPKVKHFLNDISQFSMPNKFDYIVCLWNTINQLPSEKRISFIKKCEENLKSGGTLFITTSHRYSALGCFAKSLPFMAWKYGKNYSKYYYSPKEIPVWFKATNLKFNLLSSGKELLIVARKEKNEKS